MNAKHAQLLMALAWCGHAWAVELPKVWEDPLRTLPEVVLSDQRTSVDAIDLRCNWPAPAQQTTEVELSLGDAMDMALCHNQQVKASWAAIKIQAGAVGESRAAYLPTLNASVSNLQTTTRYPDGALPNTQVRGMTQYASLTWRLLDFGARSANAQAAQHALRAALASHDAAYQKVLTSVIGAYFDAVTAQAVGLARQQALRLAQETQQATQRRQQRGVSSESDGLQASAALARAELSYSRAQGDVKKANAVLLYVMGLPTQTDFRLPEEHMHAQETHLQELSLWLQEAQHNHPAIMAAYSQWAAAVAKTRAVQAEGLPSLDYTQNYYQNGYPNQGISATSSKVTTFGFALNVPLFEGFARTYKVATARAQAEQSEAQRQDTQQQVLMEVIKTHADAEAALENLKASYRLLAVSRAAVQSSQKRYEKGAADILELLTTQNALAEAQQERARCLAEWLSARWRLIASAGVLDKESWHH